MPIQMVQADPHTGMSKNVVIIGGATASDSCVGTDANRVRNGGCFPVTGATGELGDFTFAGMVSADVSTATLANYDTAVLNVASNDMACNLNKLTASQKTDLVNFVKSGKKLVIFDSECSTQDYSWLPFPFTTANPGAQGANGTLNILEENTLSSKDPANVHYIDATFLGGSTDAVGDMNVMTTFDPNWCVDMSGTNANQITGPVHTYAKYPAGTDAGLIIYNGLDVDYLNPTSTNDGSKNLRKMWVQELQQPFNPSNLPCGVTVAGITLAPVAATNPTGGNHTVTANLTDLLGKPTVGVLVGFEVLAGGVNAGATGTCNPGDCKSDAAGNVSFTYKSNGAVGADQIKACYVNGGSQKICSQVVTKAWVVSIGVALTPTVSTNTAGGSHTVTAALADPQGNPQGGVPVTFKFISGPNAEATGTCNPGDCKSDSAGNVSFTYQSNGFVGTDKIEVCFTNEIGQQVCSQVATNEWKEAQSTAIPQDFTLEGKGGGGSIGLLDLALGLGCAGFALISRRRRTVVAGLLSCLVVTTAVIATPPALAAVPGWYAGASGGWTKGKFSSSDLQGDLAAKGYNSLDSVNVDNTDTGWKLFGGYQFNPFIAAEASYVDLGDITSTVKGKTDPANIPQPLLNDAADVHGYLAKGWTLAGVGIWPVKPTVSLFAKAGLFAWTADVDIKEVSSGLSTSRGANGTNGMFGVGARFMPHPKWELRAEYERYQVSSDWANFFSLGAAYHF
ncbi:MAG: outer membrane beta-barrel protein [Gammaproteobacteria bacterium]